MRSQSLAPVLVLLFGCGQTTASNVDERRPFGAATGAGGDASSAGGHGGSAGTAIGGATTQGGSGLGTGAFGASAGKAGSGQAAAGGSGQGAFGGKSQGPGGVGGKGQGAFGGSGQGAIGAGGKGQGGFGAGGSGQGAFGGIGEGGFGTGGNGQGAFGAGGSGTGAFGGFGPGAFGAGGAGQGAFGAGGQGQGGVGAGGAGKGGFGAGGTGQGAQAGFGQGAQGGSGQGGIGAGGAGQGAQAGFGQGAGGFPLCQPGTGTCLNNDTVQRCNASGTGYIIEICDVSLGIFCDPPTGSCVNPCTSMLVGTTTIGCEYFPTVTSNGALYSGFHFAVSVANATLATAHVSVMRAGHTYATATVAPGGLQTMTLPWVDELRHDYATASSGADVDAALTSGIVKQGGYILASDAPVSVFQFNPLEYEIPQPADGSCPDPHGTGKCNSFTNDASLLLPQNALGTEYIVASRATLNVTWGGDPWSLPGLVAVTASKNGTSVTVKSTSYVRAGAGVNAMSPGDVQTFTLDRGDVLQLLAAPVAPGDLGACVSGDKMAELCAVPATYDLTGTVITSDKPVVVIGGHDCDFVPYTKFACDHLEQSLFPVNTWGTSTIVSAPQSVLGAPSNDGKPDVHVTRVIAGKDGVTFTVEPALPGFVPPAPLAKGQWVELPMVSNDYVIDASGPIQVVQYMAGGDVVDPKDIQTPKSHGDPSMSLSVPTSQYRRSSTFLAPVSYEFNFANVVAPAGVLVTLDGAPLGGPPAVAIGSSGYTVRRVAISGGAHKIESNVPVGVVVYGYGTYTSYMYPGGLALEVL